MQGVFHVHQFIGLGFGEFVDRNPSPRSNDVGNFLGGYFRFAAFSFLFFGGGDVADLLLDVHFPIAQFPGFVKVLVTDGFIFFFQNEA